VSALDVSLVFLMLAAAAGFLVWSLFGRSRKPACHTVGGGQRAAAAGPEVIVGAALARGLERAQEKRRSG
jgi:hypothetical protein